MKISGKKFLITGGAGFIGSHTAKELINKGAKVVIVDRISNKRKNFKMPGAKIYKTELSSPKLALVFKKERPDYIYHFASKLMAHTKFDPLSDTKSISASVHLFELAKIYNIKKIIFSSSGILYADNSFVPTKESSPVEINNPYAISKYVVENYLRFYKQEYDLPYVILRYTNVYGPDQRAGGLSYFINKLRNGEQAEIRGDGSKTRDYIYIDDVVRANLLALNVPKDFPNPIFNVSSGKEITLNELYDMIARMLNKEARPIYTPDRPGEQIRFCLNPSKFTKLVGWKAKTDLKSGLSKVIKSL